MDTTILTTIVGAAFLAGAASSRLLGRPGPPGAPRGQAPDASREVAAEERVRLFQAMANAAPMAMVLLSGVGTISYTNTAARELLFEGRDPTGENLLAMLDKAPAPLRDALLGTEDALFTVEIDGAAETFHLTKRTFDPASGEGDAFSLITLRQMTRELQRQEVAVWKKLLRVLSHELNNSLAPIGSMAHTARAIAASPDSSERLEKVFATIEAQTTHLHGFLEGYAELARLPEPRRSHVLWSELLERVRAAWPEASVEGTPGTGFFDLAQMTQVVRNLVKNAKEAGSALAEVRVSVAAVAGGFELSVRDRGPGMSAEVLRSALLPFYSTKERGTGVGLALTREVVEAHGGTVRLQNREGGGLEVACFLPDAKGVRTTNARLTLSRG
jgi:two-component system nitrogen regulation sensor histidine kinase NtrY